MSGFRNLTATLRAYVETAKEAKAASDDLDLSAGFQKLIGAKDNQPGAPTDLKAAFDLVAKFDELTELLKKNNTPQFAVEVSRGRQYLDEYFRRFFPQLGRFDQLLRDFQRWQEQQMRATPLGRNATSGTLPTAPSSSTTSVSLMILQKVGGVP